MRGKEVCPRNARKVTKENATRCGFIRRRHEQKRRTGSRGARPSEKWSFGPEGEPPEARVGCLGLGGGGLRLQRVLGSLDQAGKGDAVGDGDLGELTAVELDLR